jgi:hypothetical protein
MNIIPKQEGQATVASRAPQWSHRGESEEAAAPHIGQLSVSAGMSKVFPQAVTICKLGPYVVHLDTILNY